MSEDKKVNLKLMNAYSTYLSDYHTNLLRKINAKTRIPIARLIAIAVDNELMRDNPCNLDLRSPETDYEEFKFSSEATKILTFIKKLNRGLGLDYLLLLRYDIGVEDKEKFKEGFRELQETGMIESEKPLQRSYKGKDVILPDNYKVWKAKSFTGDTPKKRTNKADRYALLQKLKKEFPDE